MRPISLLSAALLAAPALGQGADLCSAAQAITGAGPHAFDNLAALTDGTTASCGEIYNDVWFSFTAADSVDHVLSLCAGATHDTKVAVYDGSCAGVELACNDDACALQSQVTFPAVAGQTYLLRIGNFADGQGGAGSFTVTPDLPIVNPATGHAYKLVQANLSWDGARAEAQATLYQGSPGDLASIETQAELDWILANVPLDRPWIGLFHDTSSPTYSEPGGGWAWVSGNPVSFTNWAPGEPNNTSATGGPEDYAEMWASGLWNDAELNHSFTDEYLIEWDGGIGTTYCNPAVPNTTGVPARISAVGSDSAGVNDLTLQADSLPQNEFGIFINSLTPGAIANPGNSQGVLCVVGAIGRYNRAGELQNSGTTGTISLPLDLTDTPTPSGAVTIAAGETWYFQAWYRDFIQGQGATSNFTDAIEITFQ